MLAVVPRQWDKKGVVDKADTTDLLDFISNVTSLSVSSKGKLLIAGSYDGTLKVSNLSTWSTVLELKHGRQPSRAVDICLDSKFAVSLCRDGVLKVWDLHLGKCVLSDTHDGKGHEEHSNEKHSSEEVAMAVSEDGELVLTASETSVKRWEGHVRCALNLVPSHVESVYKSSLEVHCLVGHCVHQDTTMSKATRT